MFQKPTENLTYFLYARKSSDSEDRQIQSIDDQISRLRDLAKSYHININKIFIEARSAKKPNNRPIFSEMISRIEKGEANAILCWEINRLTRNPIESGLLSWHLQQGTIKCIQTIDRKFLPDDNVVIFNVESSIANQYIIDLRKNSMRGMVGKAERGWFPSNAPIGYLNDNDSIAIKPDPDRYGLVKKMWEMMLSGKYSPTQIKQIANNQWGFRSVKKKRSGDKQIGTSLIYKIFNNIFYTGIFKWSGKLYEGKHQPMITLEEYDRVQIMLGRKGQPRLRTHEFSYTGLIKCENCGSYYTADKKFKYVKSRNLINSYVYYHCTRKRNDKVSKCIGQKPLTLIQIESQIEQELINYTILPEFYFWAKEFISNLQRNNTKYEEEINNSLLHNLSEAETNIQNLIQMRYKDQINEMQFSQEYTILKNRIISIKSKLSDFKVGAPKTNENLIKIFEFAAFSLKHFVTGSIQDKRDILTAFGSNLSIIDKKLNIQTDKFLVPIQTNYPALESEFKRLELDYSLDNKEYNQQFETIRLRWLAVVEDIRTIVIKNPSTAKMIHFKQPQEQTEALLAPKDNCEPDSMLKAA